MDKKTLSYQLTEVKADGETGEFEGYGSVFGVVDSYDEIVEKGAFKDSLKKKKPKLLIQHSSWMVGGVFLEAREDDKGLYLKGQLNLKVGHARETYELMKQGAIDGMSIGFRVLEERFDRAKNIRILEKVDLMEVSIVTFPANEAARITDVKSAPQTIRSFEDFLRDAGKYSQTDATYIALNGFRAYEARRDGGDLSSVVTGLERLTQQLRKSLPNGDSKGREAR